MSDVVRLVINGRVMTPRLDPRLQDGVPMVPVRHVVESFGGEVEWDSTSGKTTIILRDRTAQIVPGSRDASSNGNAERMESPALVVDNTLLAPAPFLARALDVGYGWDESVRLVLLMSRESHLAGRRVVLDPGHGGSDPGAIGPGGLVEKAAALDVARRSGELLRLGGVAVTLTRDTDVYRSLAQRTALSQRVQAEAFVSIHCNSSINATAHGTETYYFESWQGQKLSVALQQEMVDELQSSDRGVREASFYVLRHTSAPAALVEVAFISNPSEERLLGDPWMRERAALAVFRGVRGYLERGASRLNG